MTGKAPLITADARNWLVSLACQTAKDLGYPAAARGRGSSDAPLPLWIAAYTDIVFRLRARTAAERHPSAGRPTYLYEFARPLVPPAHGVPHTAEIPFVFGTYADPFLAGKVGDSTASVSLSAFMLPAWASFAHSGTPGSDWAKATGTAPSVNVLAVQPDCTQ